MLEIRYRRLRIQSPKGKKKRYPELTVTVIEAREQETPCGRDRIDWKLITDLPVASRREAIEKVQWYALRWKIETFHQIMKSGCKAEQSRLRTAARLVNLLAVMCILSWRIFIFLPLDYPPWRAHWFYSEQYLLAASLLAGHRNFEVALPNYYITQTESVRQVMDDFWNRPELAGISRTGGSFLDRNEIGPAQAAKANGVGGYPPIDSRRARRRESDGLASPLNLPKCYQCHNHRCPILPRLLRKGWDNSQAATRPC